MSSETTNNKLLVIAFPSVGLVGAFATSYLVNQLQMKDVGELEFAKISPTYVIHNGEIYGPIRIYNKDNLYAILASIPLNSISTYDLIVKAIEFAKNNGIRKIIIPRGLEAGENYKNEPTSHGLAVNKQSKSLLDEYHLPLVTGATVLGADASVISALKNSEIPGIILYTTCRKMFPDDDAIITSIKTLADIIKVKIDTEKFEERLESINKENEKLIEETKRSIGNSSQMHSSNPPPGVG